jgi:hypothetical protein
MNKSPALSHEPSVAPGLNLPGVYLSFNEFRAGRCDGNVRRVHRMRLHRPMWLTARQAGAQQAAPRPSCSERSEWTDSHPAAACIWLIGAFAEPDLVSGFQDFDVFGVEGCEGVNGGLGDAELIVLRIVPEVIVERNDGAGLG